MRCRPPGSSVHGILQARILEWVATPLHYWRREKILSPGDLHDPRMQPGSPASQADSLPSEPPGKATEKSSMYLKHLHRTEVKRWQSNLSHQGNRGRVFGLKTEESTHNAEERSQRYLIRWCQGQTLTESEAAGQYPGFSSLTSRMTRGADIS